MHKTTPDVPPAETAEQYAVRLESYVENQDPIATQRATAATLTRLVEGATEGSLSRPPAPGKWSARSVLAHLAEDELASSWRYRQMIEHSGAILPGFNEREWARLGDYDSWTPGESLRMFQMLREANLRMFGRLTPEEWQRYGMHAERGRITVADLARHVAAHDINHILQLRRLLGFEPALPRSGVE